MDSEARTLRFLVVDDNEDIRDVFCRLVERAGHLATTAADGQDAVEVLEHMVADASLAGIHLFFPDPWPKKHYAASPSSPTTGAIAPSQPKAA